MDDDIVSELRDIAAKTPDDWFPTLFQAAAEIERLREALHEYKHRLHWLNEELLKRGRS